MAKTLTQIQSLVRAKAKDKQIDLTVDSGLILTNVVYRRLVALGSWSEFYVKDTSLSTIAKTESYNWPTDPVFQNVIIVKMQDPNDQNNPRPISPAKTEIEFTELSSQTPGFPQQYRRYISGTTHKIDFAPAPLKGSLTIHIIGNIEPTELVDGTSTTKFISSSSDDALAYMIAAEILQQRMSSRESGDLLKIASETLTSTLGVEVTPSDLRAD